MILADKHTMPYFDGRSRSMKTRLPLDALIQTSIYDINIRDFAPFGVRQLIKFSYRFHIVTSTYSLLSSLLCIISVISADTVKISLFSSVIISEC